MLQVQPAQYSDDDSYLIVSDGWTPSISWEVTQFNGSSYLMHSGYEGGSFSYASWNITAYRYSTYYISTAIMPDFTVSLVCIISLWISSTDSRLSISITGLLAIIAVVWTTTESLPQTMKATWMSQFSNFCIIIVATVCVETAFIAYFLTKKGTPPKWLRKFIFYTNIFSWVYVKVFSFFVDNCCDCFCIAYSFCSSKPIPRRRIKRKNNVMTNSFYAARQSSFVFPRQSTSQPAINKDIEMNSTSRSVNETKNDSDDEDIIEVPSVPSVQVISPLVLPNKLDIVDVEKDDKTNDNIDKTNDNNDNGENSNEDQPMLPKEEQVELDWIRFGRAIDRVSRFVIPIAFFAGTYTYLHTLTYYYLLILTQTI